MFPVFSLFAGSSRDPTAPLILGLGIVRFHEFPDQSGNFRAIFFQGEVAGIQKMKIYVL